MMLTREDFYSKTLVAQMKAYKRFDYDVNLLYNALDTLQQASELDIVSIDETLKVLTMMHDYMFN